MNQLTAKLKNPFFKEVLLATVLFALPFLLWLHAFFTDESSTMINILGYSYDHGWGTDRIGAFWVLFNLTTIWFLDLFLRFSLAKNKLFILVTELFIVYGFSTVLLVDIVNIPSFVLIGPFVLAGIIPLLYSTFYFLKNKILTNWTIKNPFSPSGVLSAALLALPTTLYFFHFSSQLESKQTLELGLFELTSFGFSNFSIFLYVLSFKLLILIPAIFWFLTEKKWWKYALLSPIMVNAYQLRTIFSNEAEIIDEYEIIQAIPLLGIVLVILLALSKNAKDVYLFKAIYQQSYTKLEKVVTKKHRQKLQDLEAAKQELADYKSNTSKGKLEDLQALKERLEKTLKKDS